MFFKLKKLELRNFQSYGNNITTFNLDFNKSVLVVGKNLDSMVDGQIDSNGAGKSTILNALSFGLFDKTITDIPLKDLINNINQKNMEVNIEFDKDAEYRVERYRQHKLKGGNGVTLYRKDNAGVFQDITKDAIGGVDKYLEDLIGVPFEIFARIVVISATYEPFLELKLDPQRVIIEELFGFSELSKKADILKEDLKNNKKDIETLQKLDEQIKEEIIRYNKLLDETKQADSVWRINRDNELVELETKKYAYNNINFDTEEKILNDIDQLKTLATTLEQHIVDTTSKITNYNDVLTLSSKWDGDRIIDITRLKTEIAALPQINIPEQQTYLTKLQELKSRRQHKENQINVIITPAITAAKDAIDKGTVSLSTIEQSIIDMGNIDIDEQSKLLVDLNHNVTELNTVSARIRELRNNLGHATKELDRLKNETSALRNEIDILSSSECPYCHQEYKDDECKNKLEQNNIKLNEIHQQIILWESKIVELNNDITTLVTEQTALNTSINILNSQCIIKNNSELTLLRTKMSRFNEDKNKLITLLDVNNNKLLENTTLHDDIISEIKGIDSDIENIENNVIFKSNDELTKFTNILNEKTITLSNLENSKNPYLINVTENELRDNVVKQTEKLSGIKTKLDNAIMAIDTLKKDAKYSDLRQLIIDKTNLASYIVSYDKLLAAISPSATTLQSLLDNPPSELKTEQIQTLFDTIEHQEFLLKLLTKKDSFIRKALVNRYIPYLNTRIKYYLEKIGLPHKVEFQQNMTVKITQFKSELNFKSLSAGQKARVNLALSFAFRDVLQSRYGAINFCILDECLDVGLGNVGVQLATKMIKGIAKDHNISMFVISHRSEIEANFDYKLVIELKNGYSNIISSDI